MRVILLALSLTVALLVPELAISKRGSPGAALRGKKVVVLDFTRSDVKPVVAETVMEFDLMLPGRAPRLAYRAMPEMPCPEVAARKRAIVVCPMVTGGPYLGLTTYTVPKGWLSNVRIRLDTTRRGDEFDWDLDHTLCHEFMHATTGAPEVMAGNSLLSCVWGSQLAPDERDRAFAREVYRDVDHHRGQHR